MSAATGFWNGVNLGEQGRARRDVKERDEREAKLQTLINSGLPPAQVQQGIRDIYGQDAPALQRHVENLFRRMTGKQPQQAQAPMRAADLAGLEAQGSSLPKQNIDAYKAQLQAQQDATFGGNQRLIQYIQSLPQDQQAQAMQLFGVTARPQYKLYTLPDGSTQYFDPATAPAGATAVEPGTAHVVTLQGPNGPMFGTEKGGKFFDAAGNPITDASPSPKPGQPKPGVSGGKNVFGVLTPKGWVDAGTQQPLPDFRPMPNYAQVAPSLRTVPTVDPNDPSRAVYSTTQEAATKHLESPQSQDYQGGLFVARSMAPRNLGQNLASLNTALDHLDMLQKMGTALGNGDVRVLNQLGQAWAQATGEAAPVDFDTVKTSLEGELSRAFTGVGATQQEIKSVGDLISRAASPAQLAGAIQTARGTLEARRQNLLKQAEAARGGGENGPAPRMGGGQAKGTKSLKAAMALPQNKGKTAEQVTQDLKAHGYGVAP